MKRALQNSPKIVLALLGSLALCGCGSGFVASSSARSVSAVESSLTFPSDSCEGKTQAAFSAFEQQQLSWYSSRSLAMPGPQERSVLKVSGNGRAVIIVHGYNSNPTYEADLTQVLSAAGFTVIIPLLRGYGSTSVSANLSVVKDWEQSIEGAVKVAQVCHAKVSLLGHSLGGELVADELINQGLSGITHAVFLAPALRSPLPFAEASIAAIAASSSSIDVDTFRSLTGFDPYAVLPVLKPPPGEPEPHFPMFALERVFSLQNAFSVAMQKNLPIDSMVVLTESDLAINNEFANSYLRANVAVSESLTFRASDNIGHSFQRRENNPRFDEMAEGIVHFLSK